MIIIQDTREQTPFTFPEGVDVEVGTLETGDYSIKGMTDLVVIERKSLPDMVGCIGKSRERFEKELRRLRGYRYSAVVIESTLTKANGGTWKGKVTPSQLLGSICSWRIKYGIEFIYASSPALAAEETYRLLRKFHDYCADFAHRFKTLGKRA